MKIANVRWTDELGNLIAENSFDPIVICTGDSITLTATFDIPNSTPRIIGPSLKCPECETGILNHRVNDYLCPECRAVISDE